MNVQLLDFYDSRTEQNEDTIICFGRTEDGSPVRFEVRNTPHTIYVATSLFSNSYKSMCDLVWGQLENHLTNRKTGCRRTTCPNCNPEGTIKYGTIYREPCAKLMPAVESSVVDVTIVDLKGFEIEESEPRPFLKIVLERAADILPAAKFMESEAGMTCPRSEHRGVFGVNKNGVDSFTVEKGISSAEWVTIPNAGVVDFRDVVRMDPQPETNVKWNIMRFDIEVISKRYRNDESNRAEYPVGLISASMGGQMTSFMLKSPKVDQEIYYQASDQEEAKRLADAHKRVEEEEDELTDDEGLTEEELARKKEAFIKAKEKQEKTERELGNIPVGNVLYFEDESSLLMAFYNYWIQNDPDMIVGYNSNYYDVPYLIRRAERLGLRAFCYLTKEPNEKLLLKPFVKTTNQAGAREQMIIDCPGRLFVDLYLTAQSSLKLDKYGLKDVAAEFKLGGKDDVKYTDMYDYFHGSAVTRFLLLKYCVRDVDLTEKIEKRMDVIPKLIAKSRVLRVRSRDALDRGLSHVLSMKIRSVIKGEYVLPYNREMNNMRPAYELIDGYSNLHQNALKGVKYDGAYVLDPIVGLHKNYVATFDYASLYPNIMRTYNICHSTLVPPGRYPREMCNVSPSGFWFLKKEHKPGVLPTILTELLDERNKVKKKIKVLNKQIEDEGREPNEEEAARLSMWDAEQGELKVCANSIYGQLGTILSDFGMLCGAISITGWGRQNILKVKNGIEKEEQFKHLELRVDYGDTDSVMVEMRNLENHEQAFEWGERLEKWINEDSKMLEGTLNMEFEKLSVCTLFLAKKKYVMVLIDKAGHKKLKKSGLGKRDLTKYNSDTLQRILEMGMLEDRNPDYVYSYFKNRCARLSAYRLKNINLLKRTANITKPVENYEEPIPPHIVAAKMLITQGTEVRAGDRLGYYLCNVSTSKKSKKSEKAIPEEMMDGYTPDMQEYVTQMVDTSLKTTFHFFPGATEKTKKASVKGAAASNPVVYQPLRAPPRINTQGPLDAFGIKRIMAEEKTKRSAAKTTSRKGYTVQSIAVLFKKD